ncbi:unnamed protein product [Closterium sp. Naga37s-1]|nr:unnamed protein product [Closterium sp. Naga37s-1]
MFCMPRPAFPPPPPGAEDSREEDARWVGDVTDRMNGGGSHAATTPPPCPPLLSLSPLHPCACMGLCGRNTPVALPPRRLLWPAVPLPACAGHASQPHWQASAAESNVRTPDPLPPAPPCPLPPYPTPPPPMPMPMSMPMPVPVHMGAVLCVLVGVVGEVGPRVATSEMRVRTLDATTPSNTRE